MATWILGDIHGQYDALLQVLERSRFDPSNDQLIFLGDVLDRGPKPFQCIDELLLIPNKVLIRGNHDENFHTFIQTGIDGFGGGNGMAYTKRCWQQLDDAAKKRAGNFFEQQVAYHIQEECFFVHAGFRPELPVALQNGETFYWDRSLWQTAMQPEGTPIIAKDGFREIFIGHTPTIKWGTTLPQWKRGIWNLDTGAGFGDGRLTLMNLHTKAYVQSDPVTVADD